MDVPAGARCAIHTEAAANAVCERCGNFACASCIVVRDERVVCTPCSRRFLGLGGSWLAVSAAILGFASLGCIPCAPLSMVLAIVDFSRIAAKKSPSGGRTLNALGLVLSAIGLSLWALVAWRWWSDPGASVGMPEDY